jgi:hypothetical protein
LLYVEPAAEGSGKTVARTEPVVRPTSPPSPLSFRTSGFPQYGCKAGSRGTCLRVLRSSLLPASPSHAQFASPRCALGATPNKPPALCRGASLLLHCRARDLSRYPRGPRSGPGCVVPDPHRLLGPIRPTRRHRATSPLRGLYAQPCLGGSASAACEWFRAFAARSVPTCRPHRPRGVRRLHAPSSFADDTGLRLLARDSALPSTPPSASRGDCFFEAVLVRSATTCRLARLPGRIRPNSRPAAGDLYARASTGLVTLPGAGYNYGGNWASSTGGTCTRWNGS